MENELVIELRRRRITLMSLGSGVISLLPTSCSPCLC